MTNAPKKETAAEKAAATPADVPAKAPDDVVHDGVLEEPSKTVTLGLADLDALIGKHISQIEESAAAREERLLDRIRELEAAQNMTQTALLDENGNVEQPDTILQLVTGEAVAHKGYATTHHWSEQAQMTVEVIKVLPFPHSSNPAFQIENKPKSA